MTQTRVMPASVLALLLTAFAACNSQLAQTPDASIDAGLLSCEFDSECAPLRCTGSVGSPGTCQAFPALDTARILVLGAPSHLRTSVDNPNDQYDWPDLNLSAMVADSLRVTLHAAGYPGATVIDSALVGPIPQRSGYSGRLLEYVYAWTDREERLAALDDNWDFVIFFDNYYTLHTNPELMFESIRALSQHVRAAGAIPIWVMHSDARPTPDADGMLCNNRCAHHDDGACGDVPHLSVGLLASVCAYGTDCNDCGPRTVADAPAYDSLDLVWRIANGTGSVVVPSGQIASTVDAHYTEWPFVAGAAIFRALTGQDAAQTGADAKPNALSQSRWNEISTAVATQEAADNDTIHYTQPYRGAPHIEALPVPEIYRFAISGSSSERGFATAMRELLDREDVAYEDTDTGRCSTFGGKVSLGCLLGRVIPGLGGIDHHTLYARNYDVSVEEIIEHTGLPDLMPQIYDRHWDDTQNDGTDALDDIFARSNERSVKAKVYGLAWLPQHLNFAKLKDQRPSADLLSDGIHATNAVQAGLASMSWTSRTGLSASTAGVDDKTATAIEVGEHTIRTLSTLSQTGVFIPDQPDKRRRARNVEAN